MFQLSAADALTKPLFQSITASASISSLLTRCLSLGRSCLLATITMGGFRVLRVFRAASAAEMDDRRELSADDEQEEVPVEHNDDPIDE